MPLEALITIWRALSRVGKYVVAIVAAAGLVIPATLSASAYQTNGLMIYFDFSNLGSTANGASLSDLSGNGRNGTIRGSGITFDSATKSIKFPGGTNGSNYVELAGSFANFTNGVSIEFEGNFGSTLSAWERIFDFGSTFVGNSTDNQFWVGHMYNSHELALETWINGVNQGRCHTSTGGTALDTTGAFAKWLITVDATNGCRIYKNGVEQNTQVMNAAYTYSTPAAANGSAYPLPNNYTRSTNYLGRSNWPDQDLEGSIRYLRIYNTALTASQAQENAVTTYAVTYDEHGGTTVPDGTFNQGASLTFPTPPTRSGYNFLGWFTAASGGTEKTASQVSAANASVTLHAQWSPNTYNVTYDEHGGSTVSDDSYVYGNTLVFPTAPTKTGNTFLGWFDAASGGTQLSASTISARTTNSALHAQWSPNTYNVTYDEHGGSTVSDDSYVYGNTLVFPTAPTRAGYSFLGWFNASTGGNALTATSVSAGTSDVTLHAQWAPLPAQTVSWTPSNTSVMTNQSPLTPASMASTNGGGQITYSVIDAGSTGCSVNSSTGVLTFSGVGSCTVRATAASNSNYLSDTQDVAFNIGSPSPAMSLNLDVATGASVANSVVSYGASGLQNNSSWSLVLRSTPQTLASGTFSTSLLTGSTQIPSGLAAGWHSITLTGTSSTGGTISHAVWFEVSNSGTLLQTSGVGPTNPLTTTPASLANTGSSTFETSLGGLIIIAVGGVLILFRRRLIKQS